MSAEAESQRLAASEAAGEWRRAADVASTDEGRARAQANVRLAEAAEGYWAARGEVAAANTSSEEAEAELKLAENSVEYWTAVRDSTEDDSGQGAGGSRTEPRQKRFWPTGARTAAARHGWSGRSAPSRKGCGGAMLRALSIRRIVIVDALDIEFGEGLTVLTG